MMAFFSCVSNFSVYVEVPSGACTAAGYSHMVARPNGECVNVVYMGAGWGIALPNLLIVFSDLQPCYERLTCS